jgi:alpha-1,6-mannosyltransferase
MVRVDPGKRAAVRPPRTAERLNRFVNDWDYGRITRSGVVATAMIALGSYGAGALPANDPTRHIPVIGLLRHGWLGLHVALGFYYLGLILLVITWLILGRLLLTGSTHGDSATDAHAADPRKLRRTLIMWMIPLLFGMPLASMDLYSYAAQAQIAKHGLDPYTITPADLPALNLGKFLDNVAGNWVDTPSPYGPIWVVVSRWVATLTGDHALVSVLLLRLIPFAAVVVIAYLIPGLATRFGGRSDLALWVAVANPLVLVHGIGGGHNDAVMVALILGGLTVVLRPNANWRHLAIGAALMTLAAGVKVPGVVAIGFVVPIFLSGLEDPRLRDWIRSCAIVIAVALPIFAIASWFADVGFGWTRQVNSAVKVINFMSVPTMAAVAYRFAIRAAHAGTVVDSTVRTFRTVGSIISGVLLVAFWLRATRGGAIQLFALSLAVIVILGPAVQPWYFMWSLSIVALLAVNPRQMSWIAGGSVALTLLTTPMGAPLDFAPYVPAVLVAGLAARALLGPVVDHRHTAS